MAAEGAVPDADAAGAGAQDATQEPKGMSSVTRSLLSFLKKEDGPTAVEYAVMLALIIVVCVAAVSTVDKDGKLKLFEPKPADA
jgi:pilus assembly protein Flp/PilA